MTTNPALAFRRRQERMSRFYTLVSRAGHDRYRSHQETWARRWWYRSLQERSLGPRSAAHHSRVIRDKYSAQV